MRAFIIVTVMVCGVTAEDVGVFSQPLNVPRCCREGFTFAQNRSCIPTPHKLFHLKAVVDDSLMVLSEILNEDTTDISCDGEGSSVKYGSTKEGETLLVVNGDSVDLLWYPPDGSSFQKPQQFCIAREFSDEDESDPNYVAKFCAADPEYQKKLDEDTCARSTCVRKCCPPEEHLVNSAFCGPILVGTEWEPVFKIDGEMASPPVDLHMIHGHPTPCEAMFIYDDHQLLPTGKLHIQDLTLTYQEYCIDYNYEMKINSTEEMALVCFNDMQTWTCAWKHKILKPVLLSVSCVCLALTWLVYILVPQLRTGTTGRCLLSLVSAMFVAFVTIVVLEHHLDNFTALQCVATGYIGLFSILAMFFWLNIICYHIFSQVRSGKVDGQERLRVFLMYCGYAWGCPLIVVLVGLILDVTETHFIRPHIHPPSCWFLDNNARWFYQYGIILVLLIANIGFFIGSIMALKKQESYRPETGNSSHCIRVWVYLKMFIIMGILWLIEVVVWQTSPTCSVVAIIFDVINCLQGVYIFLVVVCFRKDLRVFHCGWPQLLRKEGEGARSTQEVSELMNIRNGKD